MTDPDRILTASGRPEDVDAALRPLPYDANAQPKRFYTAIGDAFAATTVRPAPT